MERVRPYIKFDRIKRRWWELFLMPRRQSVRSIEMDIWYNEYRGAFYPYDSVETKVEFQIDLETVNRIRELTIIQVRREGR